jgi:hypothetical protein
MMEAALSAARTTSSWTFTATAIVIGVSLSRKRGRRLASSLSLYSTAASAGRHAFAALLGIAIGARGNRGTQNDSIPLERYQTAQAKEALHTLLGPRAKELRYARLEDAQQAAQRLQHELPDSSWAVVHELATES